MRTKVAWGAIALLAVVYSPMAVEYMGQFFFDSSPRLWDRTLTSGIGADRALGPGSLHAEQQTLYAQNWPLLVLHTVTGGLAILIGAAQFSTWVRRRPQLHRRLGRSYLALVTVSMVGAVAFLGIAGPEGTFAGPALFITLFDLAIATLTATWLAFVAIRARQVDVHRALMTLGFAWLLAAPALRALVIAFQTAWPEASQATATLASVAVMATGLPFGALVAARAGGRDGRQRPLPGRRLDVTLGVAAAVSTAVLTIWARDLFGGLDPVVLVAALMAFGLLAVAGVRQFTAAAARDEWRLASLGLLAGIAAAGPMAVLYGLAFDPVPAFLAAVTQAPGSMLNVAVIAVAWRRRSDDLSHSRTGMGSVAHAAR